MSLSILIMECIFLILTSRQSIDSKGHIVIFKLVIHWVYLEFVFFPSCITAFVEWLRAEAHS